MKDIRIASTTACIVLVLLFVGSTILSQQSVAVAREGMLHVTFLDVGQGDATLIVSPTGTQVLIDGGRDGRVVGALQKEIGFFDTDIDMVVATHPDADHIGGLINVFKKYTVHTILLTENINDTPVSDVFQKAVKTEGATIRYARAGQIYDLGGGVMGTTTLNILFPDRDPTNLESNMSSIVAQVQYGDIEYLLTGDSPIAIEQYLVGKEGEVLASEVLKVGHHGSKTSSNELFVRTVNPQYAIISAGKDNSYGHPHKEVTDRLRMLGIAQKSTIDEGTTNSVSDGKTVWFE